MVVAVVNVSRGFKHRVYEIFWLYIYWLDFSFMYMAVA